MRINYNVTGNERKTLVNTIGKALGLKPKYLGMPSAAFQIGDFKVTKDGSLEYEDGIDDTAILTAIADAGFEHEDPVESDNEPCEASEDSGNEENEEIQEPLTSEDGLTVQVPRHTLSDTALENLQRLVDSKTTLIKKALGADALPIQVDDEKVSFPWFKKIDADSAHAYTVFVAKLCEMAKNAKRVTAADRDVDNEKYAFRCFLLRLGFIGAEFKTDRKILLQNLSGSSAFKSGQRNGGADDEISE